MLCTGILNFLLLFAGVLYAAESDTRVVQSEFDRCRGIMERVDRSIERYQDVIASLKRAIDAASPEKREGLIREMNSLENRVEYFRSRFDRAAGQADKIRSDLKAVKGGRCSSCISSSVNMYCRNAETMLTDIEEQIAKAAQFGSGLERASAQTASHGEQGKIDRFALRRSAIDSIMTLRKDALDSCSSASGKTLWSQSTINLHKADSLHAAGSNTSEKALDVIELLLKKALDACGSK
jgi:hypothetical protein